MRSFQVFATMSPERTNAVMEGLAEHAPAMFSQAVAAASAAMNARPVYLQKQPFAKRAQAVRRAISRVAANPVAEEILAVYFLECRKELLIEWLDTLAIEHEDGTLKEDTPSSPDAASLKQAVETYRAVDDDPDRDLLLEAFAAQSAIEWPDLEVLLGRDS
jgi:hypothetical protein